MILPFNIEFKNEHTIYEKIVKCTVKANDFNYTYNPSSIDSEGLLNTNLTGSFTPYATTVGLYNDNGDLLLVAKLGTPVPISNVSDITFMIKYDL